MFSFRMISLTLIGFLSMILIMIITLIKKNEKLTLLLSFILLGYIMMRVF